MSRADPFITQELPLKEGLEIGQWYSSISMQNEAFQNFAQKFKDRKKAKGKK